MGKTLVVAEKPDAARAMAKVLGCNIKKDGYIESDDYIVTWAVGHLVGLKDPEDYDEENKKWDLDALPFSYPIDHALKVLPKTAHQFAVIKKLIHRDDVDLLINGGDAGREGLLIQEWIYRLCGNRKPKKILWADSLAESTLKAAFANPKDYNQEFARLLDEAEARAEGDWTMGINYSRAITLTKGGGRTLLVYGRCQTPLLEMIAKRDQEIANFKPEPYQQIKVTTENGIECYLVDEENKRVSFFEKDKDEAQRIFKKIAGKPCVVQSFTQKKKEQAAPLLLDLATLQKQMGAKYKFSSDKTLAIAQALYEKHKILSYPRTESRFLTKDIFGEIWQHINACKFGKFSDIVDHIDKKNVVLNKYYNDRKVTDHHALIPNIGDQAQKVYPSLSDDEKKVFDAVVLSFLAIFYPPYKYLTTEVNFDVGGEVFYVKGSVPIKHGYKRVLKDTDKETGAELPEMHEGDSFAQAKDSPVLEDKITKAPPKYTVSSIIELMEKHHIGTAATRAEIIKKLIKRNYIELHKGIYDPTTLGKNYIALVPDHLKSPDLTKKFEEKLEQINEGKLEKDTFLKDLVEDIEKDIVQFKKEKPEKVPSMWDNESIGTCPICKKGEIKENAKAYGCSAYKDGCKFVVWKNTFGKKITPPMVKDLITNGKTKLIKGFISKNTGKPYSAYLKLDDEGKVVLEFEQKEKKEKKIIGKCPLCRGDVSENQKAFGCSNWKEKECKFTIWKTMGGKSITEAMVKDLLKNGETGEIKGFKSKEGKSFDAKLKLEEDGKISYSFD